MQTFDGKDFYDNKFYYDVEPESVVIYRVHSNKFSAEDWTEVRTSNRTQQLEQSRSFLESIRINQFNTNKLIYGSILPSQSALEDLKAQATVTPQENYGYRYEFPSTFQYRFVHNFKNVFPARWMIIWCLFGIFIIGGIMLYLLCLTFRKKTQFLKINKKAAENLSDESSEEEEEKEEEKKKERKSKKEERDPGNNLEKIEEQEESLSEEDSIDFSQISNQPDQPLGDLNLSQFETNSRYDHVRSHNDKNSRNIFQIKKKKKKTNKLGSIPEENDQKENNEKKKPKKKKKKKKKIVKPIPEPEVKEEPKKKKKKERSFKFLIKKTEMKIFIILNFGIFCLFAFSTETLLICFHNLKFIILEKGNFDFEAFKDKLSSTPNIILFTLTLLFIILIFLFTSFVFGIFHKLFREHWKSKDYFKVHK